MKNWTEEEINILKNNYDKVTREELSLMLPSRSMSSINTKLNKLHLSHLEWWSKEEDEILKKYYSILPVDEVLLLLPNRTKESLRNHAKKYHLRAFLCRPWNNEDIEYLCENWQILSDDEIAITLQRTRNAVKRKRNLLGFHRQDKNNINYESITKYVRGNSYQWKLDSMKNCDYKCILTGSEEFTIHHLFSVSQVLHKLLKDNNIEYRPFANYTKAEREFILDLFLKEQSKYPLGVCIRKDIHELFHQLYSRNHFSIENWNEFVNDYKNGKYDN